MSKVILFQQYSPHSGVIIKWDKSTGYYIDVIRIDNVNEQEKMGLNLNRLKRDRISINSYLDSVMDIGLSYDCRIAVVKLKQKLNELTCEMNSEW